MLLSLKRANTAPQRGISDVHPTSGTLRVLRHFAWLEVGRGKAALSRRAWLSTGAAVSRHTSTPQGHNASCSAAREKPTWLAIRCSAILTCRRCSIADHYLHC
jgi:hypothetical protein